MIVFVLLVAAAAAIFVAAWWLGRTRRLRSLTDQSFQDLDGTSKAGVLGIELEGNLPTPTVTHDLAEAFGATAFAIPATALWEIARIDGSVIRGISAASSHATGIPAVSSNYHGFLQYIGDHGASLDVQGFTDRLAGYVGEQQAADALISQGHVIQMATSPTNPGWDFLIDGHAANVKTYYDAVGAAHFATADPSTVFVLPADALNPPLLPNVSVVDGFNYGDVHDALNSSLDAGQSLVSGDFIADSATHGFPVTLIGFAVYRQVRAVRRGKDTRHAVRDFAIDSTSRLGAMFIGMKAGFCLDVASGGQTYGLASAGGGIIGLVGGAKASRWIQDRPLRSAKAELASALTTYGTQFLSDGNQQVLHEVIWSSALRSKATVSQLQSAFRADRRSLRWWLWPGADQVLRQSALEYGVKELARQERFAQAETETWVELISRPDAALVVGTVMANSPSVAARCEIDATPLIWIEQARILASQRREERSFG